MDDDFIDIKGVVYVDDGEAVRILFVLSGRRARFDIPLEEFLRRAEPEEALAQQASMH